MLIEINKGVTCVAPLDDYDDACVRERGRTVFSIPTRAFESVADAVAESRGVPSFTDPLDPDLADPLIELAAVLQRWYAVVGFDRDILCELDQYSLTPDLWISLCIIHSEYLVHHSSPRDMFTRDGPMWTHLTRVFEANAEFDVIRVHAEWVYRTCFRGHMDGLTTEDLRLAQGCRMYEEVLAMGIALDGLPRSCPRLCTPAMWRGARGLVHAALARHATAPPATCDVTAEIAAAARTISFGLPCIRAFGEKPSWILFVHDEATPFGTLWQHLCDPSSQTGDADLLAFGLLVADHPPPSIDILRECEPYTPWQRDPPVEMFERLSHETACALVLAGVEVGFQEDITYIVDGYFADELQVSVGALVPQLQHAIGTLLAALTPIPARTLVALGQAIGGVLPALPEWVVGPPGPYNLNGARLAELLRRPLALSPHLRSLRAECNAMLRDMPDYESSGSDMDVSDSDSDSSSAS